MAKAISRAKASPFLYDKEGGDAENPGLEKNKDSYKVTRTGHESDGGTTDSDLSMVAAEIYRKAVTNSDKNGMGEPALQNR
jgi:hypothetical protein